MSVPSSIMVECPMCRKETLHDVLAGKIGGKAQTVLDSPVRCKECGHVHHAVMKAEKPVELPVIISWLERSTRSSVSIGADEVLSVEDEIMCGEDPVLVTSIESNGARVKVAKAIDIQTLWGKKFDKVRVLFSISHLGKSYSEQVLGLPVLTGETQGGPFFSSTTEVRSINVDSIPAPTFEIPKGFVKTGS